MALFTQQFLIPDNGILRLGTIGGSAFTSRSPQGTITDGLEFQLGHMVPARQGILRIDSLISDDPRIFDCSLEIEGYYNKPITSCKIPGRVIIELPCSAIVRGPAGVNIIAQAWELDSFPDRGACQSALSGNGINVPLWASSFDLSSGATATFRNPAGAIVGVVAGGIVNFSLPTGAATVDVIGENLLIVFRQQG